MNVPELFYIAAIIILVLLQIYNLSLIRKWSERWKAESDRHLLTLKKLELAEFTLGLKAQVRSDGVHQPQMLAARDKWLDEYRLRMGRVSIPDRWKQEEKE